MLEDQRIEERFDDLLLGPIELTDGLELQPELVIGPAGAFAEDQGVGRDAQRNG